MTTVARLFFLGLAALTGCGAYLGIRDHGDLGVTLAFAGVCIGCLALLRHPGGGVEAFLTVLRRALLGAAVFTGIALVTAVRRDDIGGAALYGLLCAMCVVGLLARRATTPPLTTTRK